MRFTVAAILLATMTYAASSKPTAADSLQVDIPLEGSDVSKPDSLASLLDAPAIYILRPGGPKAYRSDFHVNFRWDNAVIRMDYMGTGDNLRALNDTIIAVQGREGTIDSLNVVSYSSPEGHVLYNARLSERRAAAMHRYLSNTYDDDIMGKTTIVPDGESWHMFRERALTDHGISEAQRQRLIEIIDSNTDYETKKTLIQTWDRALWNRIVRVWFKDMRRSFIRLNWHEGSWQYMEGIAVPAEIDQPLLSYDQYLTRPDRPLWAKKTILALKTNMLFDLASALNFEVEVPIGKRFSIMAEDVFPWWTFGPRGNKYALELWQIGVEPRYWFPRNTDRRDKLSGHFVGPYVASGKYDFQWDMDVNYQGYYWTTGLTYGYSMPIGKVLNLEFTASLGYVRASYQHYQPDPEYNDLYRDPYVSGKFSYFGPTKLKVSLVIPITVKYRLH